MKKQLLATAVALALVASPSLFAGGQLETVDITAGESAGVGFTVAYPVGIKWDDRMIPVKYSMNTSLNPIPNPLGPGFLTPAVAQVALQASFDAWNNVPTSFIRMDITGTTSKTSLRGFDFINELTFRTAAGTGFTAIASSPSTSLIADVTLVHGQLLDGDGDPDVSSAITVATDVDNDGDLEIPAGFYKAGTILDNDVQYNTKATGFGGMRFTVDDSAVDAVTSSVDLMCVSVHEFGHSFGLSHVLGNQNSATDGTSVTMFPLIDTGDPASELAGRTPEADDIAWVSHLYPEGSGATGLRALQAGDVAFTKKYGYIKGWIKHGLLTLANGDPQPVAGAAVFTVNRDTGVQGPAAYSGHVRVVRQNSNGSLFFIVAPDIGIVDGDFLIPVPKGSWEVGIEPLDGNTTTGAGTPVLPAQVNFTTQVGSFYGQMTFNEEFYNHNKEGQVELRPGQRKVVPINLGKVTQNVNIITQKSFNINNFGVHLANGFTGAPGNRLYAVRVPASDITAIRPGLPILVQAASFSTGHADASVPVTFAEAMLTTGTVDGALAITSLDLVNPLQRVAPFLAQENDFAPFFFPSPQDLGRVVREGTDNGSFQNLFMVLRVPSSPFAGVSNFPPLIGLSQAAPIRGLSYISDNDGATWSRVTTFDFRFSLVLSEPVK